MLLVFLAVMCPALSGELLVGSGVEQKDVAIEVPIAQPVNINFKTTAQIMNVRRQAIAKVPLYKGTYTPSPEIFGQVEDGKPWWGYYGMWVYRQGQRAIEGPSKETRYLFNPYILVAAETRAVGLIDASKVGNGDVLKKKGFPFVCEPKQLLWYPAEKRAELTYDLTEFHKQVKNFASYVKSQSFVNGFGLMAYNARDFGYLWLHPDIVNATNVANGVPSRKPIEIPHMIHCGGSCGYPGGCNNTSPAKPELDNFRVQQIPASIPVKLWKERPVSVRSDPDFVILLKFE